MLLPLLQELPRGRPGVDLLSRAVAVATVGETLTGKRLFCPCSLKARGQSPSCAVRGVLRQACPPTSRVYPQVWRIAYML